MKTVAACIVGAALMLVGACERLQHIVAPPELNGASLIIEADTAAAVESQLEDMSEQMAGALRAASIRYNGRGVSEGVVRIRLVDPTDMQLAVQALTPITGHMTLSEMPEGLIEARLKDEFIANASAQLAQDSIPMLQRRLRGIDAAVEAHAPGRLIIRTGEQVVPAPVRAMIEQQGQLTFNMVREMSPDEVAAGILPRNTILAPPFLEGSPEVVERQAKLTGAHLASATPSTDAQTEQFVLSFTLDAEGTRLFCQITRDHTGERFAVLLDNRVLTAPTITEPICGGSGQISGNFTAESASELAIILSTSLPVPFHIVEELPPPTP